MENRKGSHVPAPKTLRGEGRNKKWPEPLQNRTNRSIFISVDNFNIYPNTRLGKLVKAKKLEVNYINSKDKFKSLWLEFE